MGLSLLYLAVISILSFFVGRILPYSWFSYDRFPYRCFSWEREGKAYLSIKIQKWQNRLPDMSRILPGLIPPKNLRRFDADTLSVMVKETCVAEFIHSINSLLAIPVLRFWRGWGGACTFFIYVFLGNIPFILIQRYNRPRLVRLMNRLISK